jgi:hypothetical protein
MREVISLDCERLLPALRGETDYGEPALGWVPDDAGPLPRPGRWGKFRTMLLRQSGLDKGGK